MAGTILVVDDEQDVVELISMHLRARGYRVLTANDGLKALLLARRYLPDLVVLDVMMDGIDGLSACEILRTQPSTQNIPVILLTAAVGEIVRLNALGAGAAEFVSKPFSPAELMRRIERVLRLAVNGAVRDEAGESPAR